MSRNKCIIAFVDWFSGWPAVFAVLDKTADTGVHLLIKEIFPRLGCPLQKVTENGPENVNKVVQETMRSLKIHHVQTSVYHPQSNAKVERFHQTLHGILPKKLSENQQNWENIFESGFGCYLVQHQCYFKVFTFLFAVQQRCCFAG